MPPEIKSSSLIQKNQLPTVLTNQDDYQKIREHLKGLTGEAYTRKTPPEFTDKKGSYTFADWAYMLDQMNELHPLRTERVIDEGFIEKYILFYCTVEVTDLLTHETRIGSDVHPVVAFDKGSTNVKPINEIREFFGNAKKAALTKALRNAYSNFGVASDLYGSVLVTPPSKEQFEKFETVITIDWAGWDLDKSQKMKAWLDKKRKQFYSNVDRSEADEYLEQLTNTIQEQIQKGKAS